ncbi:MAG: SpoIIE family protein phosphatase [Acidimicrobiales bacterium]
MPDRLHPEHQDLLQFLYQLPIGVIAMSNAGEVSMMNPAASRLLMPEVEAGEDVAQPLPMLLRLAPELFEKLVAEPDTLGMISTGRGRDVDSSDGVTRFAVTAHRLRPDHVIVSLTDVTEERRLYNEQRSRARRLQSALLGRIDLNDLELSVAYLPAHSDDLSGGDWYDVINVDQDRFALVVGDIVGHDIEASATMGQLRAIVRSFALVDADPSSVLHRTESLARTIDGASCASLNYALLDRTDSTITFSSAGHPPPLLISNDGTAQLLAGGRRPLLGVVDLPDSPSEVVALGHGDILVMYTDGLIERRGEGVDDGFERLTEAASEVCDIESLDELVEALTHRLLDGFDQADDVCVLALRHRATNPPSPAEMIQTEGRVDPS